MVVTQWVCNTLWLDTSQDKSGDRHYLKGLKTYLSPIADGRADSENIIFPCCARTEVMQDYVTWNGKHAGVVGNYSLVNTGSPKVNLRE